MEVCLKLIRRITGHQIQEVEILKLLVLVDPLQMLCRAVQ